MDKQGGLIKKYNKKVIEYNKNRTWKKYHELKKLQKSINYKKVNKKYSLHKIVIE